MSIATKNLVVALRSLKLQTGSIDCSGCGREHNCSTGGCALIREAADQLERMNNFADNQVVDLLQRNGALLTAMTAISDAAIGYLEGGPYDDAGKTAALFATAVNDLSAVFVYGDDAKKWQQPLTREQLRQMVGRWVWVVVNYENAKASYKCDGWALVCTPGIVGYLDQEFSTSEVGTRFRAYAQPVSNFGTRIVSRKDSEDHAKPE